MDTWFPGHMAKAVKELRNQLERAQVVLEIRDSRVPFSSVNPELEDLLTKKRRLLVLNKADLVSPTESQRTVEYFENVLGRPAVAVAVPDTESVRRALDRLVDMVGRSNRFQTLPTVAMVVGLPNVGKSSIINALKVSSQRRAAKARVGAVPGVTRSISGFHISRVPPVFVIDTPGIMVPSFEKTKNGYNRAMRLAMTSVMPDHLVGFDLLTQHVLDACNHAGRLEYVADLGLAGPVEGAAELLTQVAGRINTSSGKVVTRAAADDQAQAAAAREAARLSRIRGVAAAEVARLQQAGLVEGVSLETFMPPIPPRAVAAEPEAGNAAHQRSLSAGAAAHASFVAPSVHERRNRQELKRGNLTNEYATRAAEFVLSRYRKGRFGRFMLDPWPSDAPERPQESGTLPSSPSSVPGSSSSPR